MVSSNPLFQNGITIRKLQATVISEIWPEVIFYTLVATMVAVVSDKNVPHHHNLGISNVLLTVLGTVLGLVISFRTSSAYERYQDGRKMWTNIITASRNLAQQIWIHVPVDRTGKGDAAKTTHLQNIIEKKTMINLIHAFSVACKHFLRDEKGIFYADLYPLVHCLPRFANGNPNESERLPLWQVDEDYDGQPISTPATELGRNQTPDSNEKFSTRKARTNSFDPEMALPQVEAERPLKPARNPPSSSIVNLIPLLRFFKYVIHKLFRTGHSSKYKKKHRPYIEYVESNIPLEVILVLSNYTGWCMRNGLLSPAIATGVTTNLTTLQDAVSNLERVCNTPLPFAYQVHLRMTVSLYLLFLPFQIAPLQYINIPATAFAAFLLLGFLEIGQEIENPFNYDLNDLDLDRFCFVIQRELHLITAFTNPKPSDFIFTESNQPFAPADRRNALELTQNDSEYHLHEHKDVEPGIASIRRTLVKGWKDVDTYTRVTNDEDM